MLLEAGLVDDAASLLALAIEALRAVGMVPEQAEAELDLAACEALRSRPERARDLAAGVAERAVARGEGGTALRAGLVLLEAWLAADRSVDDVAGATGPLRASAADARARRDDARRIAGEACAAGLPRLAVRAHLLAAIIDTGLGDLDEAAADLAGGAPLARSPHLATRTLVARAGLLLARARGDRDEASAITRRVRRDVARAGSGMASLDLRTAVGLHLGPIIGLDLERAASGSPWQLLLTAERWRAATAAVPSLRPPRSERAAAEWSRLRVLHDEVRAAPSPDLAGLHEQIAAVEMRLRRIAWADGGTGTPAPLPGGSAAA